MANRNYLSQKLFTFEAYPVLLSCNFVVTPSNGLGITLLKGGGIRNVFMHTSTTPSANNGYTNPNPANGVIMVQLSDNYNKMLGVRSNLYSPASGSALTATTANVSYSITALGTATTAQWVAKGLPVGVTPALGAAFVATATGTIGGSAAVQVVAAAGSGIDSIEVMGLPNSSLSLANSPVNGGGIILLNCFANLAVAAPATGSTITLEFYMSNSSVTVNGQ